MKGSRLIVHKERNYSHQEKKKRGIDFGFDKVTGVLGNLIFQKTINKDD
jgi:hypothetical protein